jgi:hypothetical protein
VEKVRQAGSRGMARTGRGSCRGGSQSYRASIDPVALELELPSMHDHCSLADLASFSRGFLKE